MLIKSTSAKLINAFTRYLNTATISVSDAKSITNWPIPQMIGSPTKNQNTAPRGKIGLERLKQKI
ncbi:hypothetical protein PS1M3_10190 [Pseudoalteromonas sp. PS1M3]|nr:hypothetical protein PS1M3_10190 [Pseudoalteromonas sp. PS1M3]